MRLVLSIISITLLYSFNFLECYPYGAPCSAFDSMKPSGVFHGVSRNPFTEPPPYEFTVFDSEEKPVKYYKLNSTYTVQLKSLLTKFRGFMVQARLATDNNNNLVSKRIGRFVPDISWSNKGIQLQDCEDARKYDSVTHSNNDPKRLIELTWQPASQDGPVQFFITIVEDLHTFWEQWQPASGYLFLARAAESRPIEPFANELENGLQSSSKSNSLSFINAPFVDSSPLKKTTAVTSFVVNFGNIDVFDQRTNSQQSPPISQFPDVRVNESKPKSSTPLETVKNTNPTNERSKMQPVPQFSVTNTEDTTNSFLFTFYATTSNSIAQDVTHNAINLPELVTRTIGDIFPVTRANFILEPTKTTLESSQTFDGKFNGPESSTDKELSTDPCHSFPCYNNATCKSRASENTFECLCTERWFGQHCDEPNFCIENKCKNGATCVNGDSTFTCQCPPNFAGNFCQHHCPDYLCGHGGRCIVGPNQFFACLCAPGWTGEHCREEIDECVSNPCKIGQCINQINGYRCQCPDGLMGPRCQRPCQDIYHSCPLWKEENSCEYYRNATNFFDTNCASSCNLCITNKTLSENDAPFPPVLEPLMFLLGKWTFNSTTGQRFPLDFNGRISSYQNDLEFIPRAPNMFGASSIKYRTTATNSNDKFDVLVTEGFMTLIPGKGDNLLLALHSTGNDGVTMLEEGSIQDKKVSLKTIEYFVFRANTADQVASNTERSFEQVDNYLRETVERVTADNIRFVFTNYYRLLQSYAPF